MALIDYLICKRVEYLDKQIQQLDIITLWCPDYADFIADNRFSTGWLHLADNTSIMLLEEYDIINHKLRITHYCYRLRDSTKLYNDDIVDILRAEPAEHHPHISTFPHHIHDFRSKDGEQVSKDNEQVKPFRGQDLDNPDITIFFAHMHGER